DIYRFVLNEVQTGDGIPKELGYSATEVRYYYYLKPGTNLDYGLVTLGSDQDVKELLKYVIRNKVIELYIEHDSTTIDTYFNGPGDGVLTDDNMPPSPYENQGSFNPRQGVIYLGNPPLLRPCEIPWVDREDCGEIDASVSGKGKVR
ncbi:hypothetical protein Tco_1511810, partial [Tanacetum coccineum]